jgi:plasmid stabilization system protein ParE
MLSALRFHYRRHRGIREAGRGLSAPTPAERALIDELRAGCRALLVEPTAGRTPNAADWATATNRLRSLVLHADPRAFLRWDVVIERMAVHGSPITPTELALLQARPDWTSRWMRAIRETDAGRPYRYAGYPPSSEPLIQTAYTLSRFESLCGRPITSWDTIVEFGGGFGSLCRLAHALGFRGRYVIFDLPPFTLLQRYFLRSAGVMRPDDDRLVLTSDIGALSASIDALPDGDRALFVACWSLSETPLALRDAVAPLARRIGDHWIAYQERYGEVDNVEYFATRWLGGPRREERVAHRAADRLLVGGAAIG